MKACWKSVFAKLICPSLQQSRSLLKHRRSKHLGVVSIFLILAGNRSTLHAACVESSV